MDPVTIALITAGIPFITAGFKKIFNTDSFTSKAKAGINTLIPIVLGILSAGLYSYQQTGDLVTAVAIGLGSGGVASSARNIEKNLIGVINGVLSLIKKK